MRSSAPKRRALQTAAAAGVPVNSNLALTGAEFLVSMLETRLTSTNGGSNKAETQAKAQQELQKIEQQLKKLELRSEPQAKQDATSQPSPEQSEDTRRQIQDLQQRVDSLRSQLSERQKTSDAWQRTELARHPQRPYTLDYVERIFTDWSEIHGDRGFSDDHAIVCGMARFHGEEVLVVGQQKARDTKQKVYRNWGMTNPEGYRKALRIMKIAEKFRRPIFTFVDTPGAYPGLTAEEHGQAEAIARNLREMARLQVPIVVTIIGEGGSGGALAIAVGDRILMMENSVYSVISPESCAAIMWRDSTRKELAAEALRITAADLSKLGCIDAIIPEPPGGAHNDHAAAAAFLDAALQKNLEELRKQSPAELIASRYDKFRNMAQFYRVEV